MDQFGNDCSGHMDYLSLEAIPLGHNEKQTAFKRDRVSYNRYQLEILETIFQVCKYPSTEQKKRISSEIKVTVNRVKVWFQNRRRRENLAKKNGDASKDADKSTMPDTIREQLLKRILESHPSSPGPETKQEKRTSTSPTEPKSPLITPVTPTPIVDPTLVWMNNWMAAQQAAAAAASAGNIPLNSPANPHLPLLLNRFRLTNPLLPTETFPNASSGASAFHPVGTLPYCWPPSYKL